MDIHEYHAKELLAGYGVPIQPGKVAFSADQASLHRIGARRLALGPSRRRSTPGPRQGGRHQAVQDLPRSSRRGEGHAGPRLVTAQTGPEGKIVQRVYVEVAEKFERELYLGFVMDARRNAYASSPRPTAGMDIEEIARTSPGSILQAIVEPAWGCCQFQAGKSPSVLGLNLKQVSRASPPSSEPSRVPRPGRQHARDQSPGGDPR